VQWGLKRKYVRFNVQWRLKRTLPQVCVQWGLKRDLRTVWLKRHSVPFGTYYTTDSAERRVEIASLRWGYFWMLGLLLHNGWKEMCMYWDEVGWVSARQHHVPQEPT